MRARTPGSQIVRVAALFVIGFTLGCDAPGGDSGELSERDPCLWPFAADSIWNTPIGSAAVYVPRGTAVYPPDRRCSRRPFRPTSSSRPTPVTRALLCSCRTDERFGRGNHSREA